MFIDYVALMLINLATGLVLLALFVILYPDHDPKKAAPGLLASGFISVATGLHMIFTWPLPGSYNIAFGGMAVLFGVLVFGAGLLGVFAWDLLGLAIYAALAGLAAVVVGVRIGVLGMTKSPALSLLGYVFTGAAGILTLPMYFLRKSLAFRIIVAAVMLVGAAIWAFTGYGAYWEHLEAFSKWSPGGGG